MAKYIVLASWTDQGAKSLKDSPGRLDAARALGKKLGVTIGDFYMTTGSSDMVIIADAADDEAMARFNLTMASAGNIRTNTLKAFGEEAYRKIIGSL